MHNAIEEKRDVHFARHHVYFSQQLSDLTKQLHAGELGA
jgi:hypothetical protein